MAGTKTNTLGGLYDKGFHDFCLGLPTGSRCEHNDQCSMWACTDFFLGEGKGRGVLAKCDKNGQFGKCTCDKCGSGGAIQKGGRVPLFRRL